MTDNRNVEHGRALCAQTTSLFWCQTGHLYANNFTLVCLVPNGIHRKEKMSSDVVSLNGKNSDTISQMRTEKMDTLTFPCKLFPYMCAQCIALFWQQLSSEAKACPKNDTQAAIQNWNSKFHRFSTMVAWERYSNVFPLCGVDKALQLACLVDYRFPIILLTAPVITSLFHDNCSTPSIYCPFVRVYHCDRYFNGRFFHKQMVRFFAYFAPTLGQDSPCVLANQPDLNSLFTFGVRISKDNFRGCCGISVALWNGSKLQQAKLSLKVRILCFDLLDCKLFQNPPNFLKL